MSLDACGYKLVRSVVLAISFLTSSAGFSYHGGGGGGAHIDEGGFHQNNIDDGFHENNDYHYNDINVGNYHPGDGWVEPTVVEPTVVDPTVVVDDTEVNNDDGCQTCDSYGNCVDNPDCD